MSWHAGAATQEDAAPFSAELMTAELDKALAPFFPGLLAAMGSHAQKNPQEPTQQDQVRTARHKAPV